MPLVLTSAKSRTRRNNRFAILGVPRERLAISNAPSDSIMVGEGIAAHSVQLELPPFTLIGATTRAGMLTSPLRARFGIVQRLAFYEVNAIFIDLTRKQIYTFVIVQIRF
jgi:hypothetical protein